MLLLEKVSQLRIEPIRIYMEEVLNEIPAQVNSREILDGSYEASGSILLIFDRYRFCFLFCQAWLGNHRQVAQNQVLKLGHLICKPGSLDYNFKAPAHTGSECPCTLWTSSGSLKAQHIWKSSKRSHNWTSTLQAFPFFSMCQLSYSSTDFCIHKIVMRLFTKTLPN